MTLFSKVTSLISALFVFIGSMFSVGIVKADTPKTPEQYDDTIMFVSDFQNNFSDWDSERTDNFAAILEAAMDETPGLVVGGGDYQSSFAGTFGSAFGVSQMKDVISNAWDYDMQYLLIQGNHDTPKSVCINETGMYEFDKYIVYAINEDDFPWNEQLDVGIAEKTVQETATALSNALAALVEAGDSRPVFVVSHLPLHYSERSSGEDNRYAEYLFDAISNNADDLNIVYLYGHNHSGTYDDYIGGAVNYISKGETMLLGGTSEEKTLNFVYTNCGYIGYSNNTNDEISTNTLTATFVTVSDNGLNIRKYSKDGIVMQTIVPAVYPVAVAA